MRAVVVACALAILASGCGKSSPTSPTSPTSPSNPDNPSLVTVFITNFVYAPNPVIVKQGQQVNWKNNDSTTHTATIEGMFNNVVLPTSATGAPVTLGIGTYNYHCTLHAGMTGQIVVVP